MNLGRLLASSLIVIATGAVAVPLTATAESAADCQVVATTSTTVDGASYRAGAHWFTYERTITATTTSCADGAVSTQIVKGPWQPRPGVAAEDNPGFPYVKRLEAENQRLRAELAATRG